MSVLRWAAAAANNANSRVASGLYGGTSMIGIGYATAEANLKYCRAVNNVVPVLDLGFPIDTTGNAYDYRVLFNDGVHLWGNPALQAGAPWQIVDTSANLPSAGGYFYFWNEGNASGDIINLDFAMGLAKRT
jgi:hypothetical protein